MLAVWWSCLQALCTVLSARGPPPACETGTTAGKGATALATGTAAIFYLISSSVSRSLCVTAWLKIAHAWLRSVWNCNAAASIASSAARASRRRCLMLSARS